MINMGTIASPKLAIWTIWGPLECIFLGMFMKPKLFTALIVQVHMTMAIIQSFLDPILGWLWLKS